MCEEAARFDLQLLIALFGGLSTLLNIWLAHRSKMDARDRRWFYTQMRGAHDLEEDSYRRSKASGSEEKGP